MSAKRQLPFIVREHRVAREQQHEWEEQRLGGGEGLGGVSGDSWDLSVQYSVAMAGTVGLRGTGKKKSEGNGKVGRAEDEMILRSSHGDRVAEWKCEKKRSLAGPPPPTAASLQSRRREKGNRAEKSDMRSDMDTLRQNVSLSRSAGEMDAPSRRRMAL